MKTTIIRGVLLALASSTLACSPVLRTVKAGQNTATYYTAEGGMVIRGGKENAFSYCVAPPAQGVRQRTGEIGTKVTARGRSTINVGVEANGKVDHETARLYTHTDASLFMQHGLYRTCEMEQNGGFDNAKQYQDMTKEVLKSTLELIKLEAKEVEARKAEADARKAEAELQLLRERAKPADETPTALPAAAPSEGGTSEVGNG